MLTLMRFSDTLKNIYATTGDLRVRGQSSIDIYCSGVSGRGVFVVVCLFWYGSYCHDALNWTKSALSVTFFSLNIS